MFALLTGALSAADVRFYNLASYPVVIYVYSTDGEGAVMCPANGFSPPTPIIGVITDLTAQLPTGGTAPGLTSLSGLRNFVDDGLVILYLPEGDVDEIPFRFLYSPSSNAVVSWTEVIEYFSYGFGVTALLYLATMARRILVKISPDTPNSGGDI